MTIDSKITVRATKSKFIKSFKPPNIDSTTSTTGHSNYDERLFLCPKVNMPSGLKSDFEQNRTFFAKNSIWPNTVKDARKNGILAEPWLYKKLPKCLALNGKIYYNNVLYVVGLRLVHMVAKLRKVAEVFITDFNYLAVPHIANSKRTVVAK